MTLWIILTILSLIAAVAIVWPFLRAEHRAVERNVAIDLAREQVKELEADRTRGLIGEDEAKAARTEIERRLLAVADQEEIAVNETGNWARLIGICISVGWVVVGSAVLYTFVGRPDMPSGQTAARAPAVQKVVQSIASTTQQSVGNVDDMITGLANRLEENPEDADGWRMLGWSHFQTEDYTAATQAYAKAVALDDSDPLILSVYGEAMVRTTGGEVTDAALDVFHKALAIDPIDPRARFFQGMALEQRGDPEGAIRLWVEILDTAPADADWAPGLSGRVEELAASIGFDLAALGLEASPVRPESPTATDIAASQQMSAEDRQEMILGMVEGLAARLKDNDADIEGWIRLIRSYSVLKDMDSAKAALERARMALGPESPEFTVIEISAAELGIR